MASKLLYIVNIDFPPVAGPGVWRMLALAKYAAQAGHRVHVFCADRATWHNRRDHNLLDQLPVGVEITRISSLYERDLLERLDNWRQSSNRVKRAIGSQLHWWVKRYLPDEIILWVFKGIGAIVRQGLSERPDAIVTTGPPHLVHSTGYVLSILRKRTVWMMDFRDPWVEDPSYGQVHAGPYQYQLMRRLQRLFIRRASWVAAVSQGFLEPLCGFDASSKTKFKVITNGHDLSPELPPARISAQHGNKKLVIHFNGTIQEGNDVFEALFLGIRRYCDTEIAPGFPEVSVSFCGMPKKTKELVERIGVAQHVHDYGPLSQSESQTISRSADVLLVTVTTNLLRPSGVIPAKLYEAIALGKPILAIVPDPSDVREILKDDPVSICVEPHDENTITNSLATLARCAMDGTLRLTGAAGERRVALANRYHRKALSGDILRLLGFAA